MVPLDPGAVDVLKVAHHGSEDAGSGRCSTGPRPGLAVISVGDETPTATRPETLAALRSHGVPVASHRRPVRIEVGGRGRRCELSGWNLRRRIRGRAELDLSRRTRTPGPRSAAYLIAGNDGREDRAREGERPRRRPGPRAGPRARAMAGEGRRAPDARRPARSARPADVADGVAALPAGGRGRRAGASGTPSAVAGRSASAARHHGGF